MDCEFYGKTITEAINNASQSLNVNVCDLEYTVLEKGGLFRKARIKAKIKEKLPASGKTAKDTGVDNNNDCPVHQETKQETSQPENVQGFICNCSPYQDANGFDEYVNSSVCMTDIENLKNVNVVSKGCQYYDSFDEKFFDGKLYYKNNAFVFISDDGSKICSTVMPFKFMNAKNTYCIQKQVIDVDGSIYHFSDNYEERLFLRYVEEYNEFIKCMISEAQRKCEDIFNELIQQPEMTNAIQNFLDMIPEVVFIDHELYRALLHMFCFRDEISKDYLGYSQHETENAIAVLMRTGNQGAFQEIWGLIENLQNIIVENNNVNVNCVNLVSYMLINYGLVQRYSRIWEDNYDINLDVIEWENYVRECYFNNCIMSEDNRGITALAYALLKGDSRESTNYRFKYDAVVQELVNAVAHKQKENFAKALFSERGQSLEDKNRITIEEIDLMSGIEFEKFISELFRKMGYISNVTKASGDQGVDVIVEKNGVKIGIQAKCYSNAVGNSAIQEAAAGKKYYACNRMLVVTNNYYTKSAIELAAANGVTLWNRDVLSEKIKAFY